MLNRAPDSQITTWVVDMRGITFMDSSGLRALVIADRRARAAGIRLIVVRGSAEVTGLLELTGIAERLELVDTAPEVVPDALGP